MQYPLISEYVRAIQDASSNLDKLAHLVPVQDDHGEPYRSSGAFAVVFKMKDEQTGKCYALKCFTEEQEGRAEAYRQIADELEFANSAYITSVKYLDKEIFVDSSCEEDEFPVLLMDWIDGETMEDYIAENYQDNYAMAMLCYRFCKMVAWLRSQPFSHGDIKPDNIMVRPDGSLTLVDYDGMFVPAMKGQKSPTIGTKDFSHPLRTIDDFDETIDDFALASIALSLKAIFVDSSCEEDEFPVLLMDWIDGETMEDYIAENYQDNYAMAMLCYRFCKMVAWLRSQPFSHGDIKPDNIMVRPDGSLTLVDYDGMFVPAMKGQKSPTIGTKDFSHPLRTIDDFDETIDDFALASIALSLKAISLKPSLFDEYGAADRLLFTADDYCDLSKSKVMAALLEQMNNEKLTTLLSMFLLANAKKNLALCSFRTFSISKPFYDVEELIKLADLLFEKSKDEADHKKAFRLYSIADSKESLYAKACLGYCYCLGKGVSEDKEK